MQILEEVRDAMVDGDVCMNWMTVSVMMLVADGVVENAVDDFLVAGFQTVDVSRLEN